MAEITEIISKIEDVSKNADVPRKIRERLNKVAEELKNENQDIAIRVTTAIYELDLISNDINIPVHIKTILWDIIGELEGAIKC